jgi:hypothetical protein
MLLAVVALCTAIWIHADRVGLYAELNENQAMVDDDYDALVNQRRIVDRYHRRYQTFHDLGFIGRESRLDWVETMRLALEGLDLPRMTYAIEPQQGVVAPFPSMLGGENIQIRVSNMQLEMGLMHEVDLLRFFDRLQEQAPGLIKVDRCEISNVSDASTDSANPNLIAKCGLQIFSVMTSDVSGDAI